MNQKFSINQDIKVPSLRVVLADGDQAGIMPTQEALMLAQNRELDLVLINETANPPVAKIIDFGKFRYEQTKKAKEAAKKARINRTETKEIVLRPNTDVGDLDRLQSRAAEWIKEGDRVKITMQFRGREHSHKAAGLKILQDFISGVELSKIDGKINEAGRGLQVSLIPSHKAK
jgi:translation initiation factor IF-3